MPRDGRRIAFAVLAVATIGLCIAAAYWNDIATKYYVYRLDREEGYLKRVLEEPSMVMQKRTAILEFLLQRHGREKLFGIYLDSVERILSARSIDINSIKEKALFRLKEHFFALEWKPSGKAGVGGLGCELPPPTELRAGICEHLKYLAGEHFESSRFPGLRFSIGQKETILHEYHNKSFEASHLSRLEDHMHGG